MTDLSPSIEITPVRSEVLFHMPSATDYPLQGYTDGAHCSNKGKRVTPVPRSKTCNSKSTPKGKAVRKTNTANPSLTDYPPSPDTPSSSSSSQIESPDSSSSSSDDEVCSYKARIIDLESKLARLKKKAKKIKISKKLNTLKKTKKLASLRKSKKRRRDISVSSDEDSDIIAVKQRKFLHNSGLKAGDSLSDRVRKDIWKHKFVDFHHLLYPHQEDSYQLAITTVENTASLGLAAKKKRKLSEREWGSAFDDYVAIYTRKHPEDMQDLLTYSKFIKKLMGAGDDWHYYDYHFRKDREHYLCKWSHIRVDLQIDAARNKTFHAATTSAHGTNYSRRSFVPIGYCFNYHAKHTVCQKGRSCTFNHTCPRCSVFHPAFLDCAKYHGRRRDDSTNNTPTPSKRINYPNASTPSAKFFPNKSGHSNQISTTNANAPKLHK